MDLNYILDLDLHYPYMETGRSQRNLKLKHTRGRYPQSDAVKDRVLVISYGGSANPS